MHAEGEIQCGEGIWMRKSDKFNECGMSNATWGRDLDGEILQITSIWMGKSYKLHRCGMSLDK